MERKESWGIVRYDVINHRFSCFPDDKSNAIPYPEEPLVLNVYVTLNCNMNCRHCVTKDFQKVGDLEISARIINWINESPFMVVVITGGEPFLPEYESHLGGLLQEIHGKGLIVDTNGTILPKQSIIDAILQTNTLVRVSWDSVRPQDEIYLRQVKPNTLKQRRVTNLEYYDRKLYNVQRVRDLGVNVAIQSVIHRRNLNSINGIAAKLRELSIKQWYIQRFIPSYLAANDNLELTGNEYDRLIARLTKECQKQGIECIAKRDRRHNCVFMLVGNGLLFTQGEKPRQKIELGSIKSPIRYFRYVSSADHAERYYG